MGPMEIMCLRSCTCSMNGVYWMSIVNEASTGYIEPRSPLSLYHSKRVYIHTYKHTCVYTFIHTHVQASIEKLRLEEWVYSFSVHSSLPRNHDLRDAMLAVHWCKRVANKHIIKILKFNDIDPPAQACFLSSGPLINCETFQCWWQLYNTNEEW